MNRLKLGLLLSAILTSTTLLADNPASNMTNGVSPSFQALSSMPTTEQESLVIMTSKQLAEIEGTQVMGNLLTGFTGNCFGCNNIAVVIQNNISIGSGFSNLTNIVGIGQGINY